MGPSPKQIDSTDHGSWLALVPGPDYVDILDQRLLPMTTQYLHCTTGDDIVDAIRILAVRGAPLIGLAAVYGLWLYALTSSGRTDAVQLGADRLKAARPTAVNLAWAVDRALATWNAKPAVEALQSLGADMADEDRQQNLQIGRFGADWFRNPVSVLTHCNTGTLATAGYGTALGVIRSLHADGKLRAVYADETRPLLQGARLTAWELVRDQIAVTVIADGAAAFLMSQGYVDAVVVGADRITANGDTANKIGTLMLAVLARHYGLDFLVAAPWSTIDFHLSDGSQIPIEERSAAEILGFNQQRVAAEGSKAWNPAFDVTPADLITAIITERGVVRSPLGENLLGLNSN